MYFGKPLNQGPWCFTWLTFIKSSRANTPKPTRWSYAPAPPTSRTCWIRTPPSIPLSSWRYLGDCFLSNDASLPGCTIRSPECHPGVHVCWRGEISCRLKKLSVVFLFGTITLLWPGVRSVSCRYCNEVLEVNLLGFKPSTTIFEILCNQVNVAQEQLPAFLKTAEKLKIKGLAEGTQGAD